MFCISKKWFSQLIEIPCISNYREAEKKTDENVAGYRHGPARHPRLPPVSVRGPWPWETHRPRLGEQMHTDKHFRYEATPPTPLYCCIISFMIEIFIISVQQSMRLPPAAARLQCRENQGACRGIFYCTTPSIPSLIVLNVTLALRFMLWVVSCISWRVISPRYITVVFRLSSSWTRTTRRLGTGAARLASNWRTLTKPRKVSWELKKCREERTKMWRSGSNSATWS